MRNPQTQQTTKTPRNNCNNMAFFCAVSGYPTHVVIDRNGMVAGRLIGGSENRHEDLRPVITRALEQK